MKSIEIENNISRHPSDELCTCGEDISHFLLFPDGCISMCELCFTKIVKNRPFDLKDTDHLRVVQLHPENDFSDYQNH